MLAIPLALTACPGGRCDEKSYGGPFCVPDSGVAPAGQKVTLEIVDSCGGSCGNTGTQLSCAVARDGGHIELSIAGSVCEPPPGTACPAICATLRFDCELPPLPEGDYTVVAQGQPAQLLKVRDGGTAAPCSAPPSL